MNIQITEHAKAEQLKEQGEVRTALRQAGAAEAEETEGLSGTKHGAWFTAYVLLLAGCAALYCLAAWNLFGFSAATAGWIQRLARGATVIVFILGAARASRIYLIERLEDHVSRYNLLRIQKLIVGLALVFTGISILFVNWYAAVVSLGLISLILGFALQTPISSFIGWIYIMARVPYRVGDRIRIGD